MILTAPDVEAPVLEIKGVWSTPSLLFFIYLQGIWISTSGMTMYLEFDHERQCILNMNMTTGEAPVLEFWGVWNHPFITVTLSGLIYFDFM